MPNFDRPPSTLDRPVSAFDSWKTKVGDYDATNNGGGSLMIRETEKGVSIFVDDGIGGNLLVIDRAGKVAECSFRDTNGVVSKDSSVITPQGVIEKATRIMQAGRYSKSPF